MKTLILIPARKGSKGIKQKNMKLLDGKPLISYSIEYALENSLSKDICISTDDDDVIKLAENYGIKVPFKRPTALSTDQSSTYDLLIHALNYYHDKGIEYDKLVLLQPTSPFRKKGHLEEANKLFSEDIDLVLSVCETKANPYHVLFEEDLNGFIMKSKNLNTSRRQDVPIVYQANGSIYVFNVNSLKKYESMNQFKRVVKYVMTQLYSVDIDDHLDWNYCEFILDKGLLKSE